MSLRRLNYLLMREIIPFNFGMDYDSWVEFYNGNPTMRELCPTDPATWSEETRQNLNNTAKEERELVDRLMKLSDDEFYSEADRLVAKT